MNIIYYYKYCYSLFLNKPLCLRKVNLLLCYRYFVTFDFSYCNNATCNNATNLSVRIGRKKKIGRPKSLSNTDAR